MITLLDYGAGNVRSVINAIEYLGETVRVVTSSKDIRDARALVFPGVGAFGNMMRILEKKHYVEPLHAYLTSGRPFLGICLGLQALFDSSEEAPGVRGLGVISGQVTRFNTTRSVPHIGWNGLNIMQASGLFNTLKGNEKFYFVHSYHVVPDDDAVVLTTTDYGYEFVSSIQKDHIVATQFHPEKSGPSGLAVLKNFLAASRPNKLPAGRSGGTRLAKRIIACLDVRSDEQGDLVVTKGNRYDVRKDGEIRNLGRPVDLAGRYYREGADEITFLNITGFRDFPLENMPLRDVLEKTSENVFVPLTIGGGIRDYTDKNGRHHTSLDVAAEYFRSGADKVSIGSDAVLIAEKYLKSGQSDGKSSIEAISRVYGSQAVVISIDPRRIYVASPEAVPHHVIETRFPGPNNEKHCWYQCTIKGGREGRDLDAVMLARICEALGAGEILLNCIDRDGTHTGFDLELIHAVSAAVSIPIIASSGAGCVEHFHDVFTATDVEAVLAAGIFHRNDVTISEVKHYLKEKGVTIRPWR